MESLRVKKGKGPAESNRVHTETNENGIPQFSLAFYKFPSVNKDPYMYISILCKYTQSCSFPRIVSAIFL